MIKIVFILFFLECHQRMITALLHFVAFFHVASLFVIGVDNRKVDADKRKSGGRQQKSSIAGQ